MGKFAFLTLVSPVGEKRVTQPCTYREYRPRRNFLHERRFAQALHHRVIVHDDRALMVADARDGGHKVQQAD